MHSLIWLQENKGVSLVEVLVVVIILGILAGLGVPNLASWIKTYGLKKSARQMVTDLQFAKMKAVAERLQYRVSFDNANNTYVIEKGNSGSGSTSWTQVDITRQLSGASSPYYAKGVSLRENLSGNMVAFSPTGNASTMGTIKFSSDTCTDGTASCQASPKRTCEKCVTVILSGRVALVE